MSLQTRLGDLVTAIATDIKLLRTYTTGSSTGDLTGLTTTDKTSVVSAINEVKAGSAGAPPSASETTSGIAELATQTETNAGTDDARIVTPLKLQTRMAAYAQPLDADLTAIAALASQTTYGRAFLTLVNQAGLLALFPAASQTVASILRISTQTETNTGTDDATAVSPLKLQTRMAAYAQPLAANLTTLAGFTTDTDVALAANSDTRLATQKAAKGYADNLLNANDAMQYKGVIDASASPNYPAANAGWTYKISVAGKIGGASGVNVEVGDTLYCLVDGSAAGTQATVGANWNIVQSNIDGALTGPSSSTSADIATFNGTTGKVVQDSGVAISTDGTMAGNSDAKLPTEKAVRTYTAATFYTQTQLGNYDTDLAGAYATAKA